MTQRTSYGRSASGVELTGDVLERLAREAEVGLDPGKLRRPRRSPRAEPETDELLPVPLDRQLRKAVADRAVSDEITTSEVVSEALRRYLEVS